MNPIETLLWAFAAFMSQNFPARKARICRKCKALEDAVFCERSMLGEPGACVFEELAPCQTFASFAKVPA